MSPKRKASASWSSTAPRWPASSTNSSSPSERRYPFIKAQYSRTTGEALTTKILQEVAARQLSADAILINNYTQRIFMKRNIITPYLPPTAKNFPPGFADQQGYWYGFYLVPYAITYNTSLVSKANAPKSFDDLLLAKMERADIPRARRVSGDPSAYPVPRPAESHRLFQEAGAPRSDHGQRPQQTGGAADRRRISHHRLQRHRQNRGVEAQRRAGGMGARRALCHGASHRVDHPRSEASGRGAAVHELSGER